MKKPKTILKDLIGGSRGSIELSALFLFFAAFSLCLLMNQQLTLWHTEIKQRSQSLLCFKRSMDQHDSIHEQLNLTNKAIIAANATFVITRNPISLQVKKATQMTQNIMISNYLLNLAKAKECKAQQKLLLTRLIPINIPPKRTSKGTIKFRKYRVPLIFPLSFSPVPTSFLIGRASLKKELEFSSAKEAPFI